MIKSAGLDVPQITKVFEELKSRGACKRSNIYTPEQAQSYVEALLAGTEV